MSGPPAASTSEGASVVAIDLPGGPDFVDALRRVWDDGDAAFPIDQRLPATARAELIATIAPSAVIGRSGRQPLDGRPTAAGDALVIATSGTSGVPKGVVLTHDAVRAAAVASSQQLGITASDVWLACLPLAHIGGLGVVTRAVLTGTGLVVHDGFDAAAVVDAAARGATAVSLVGTALARIDPTLFRVILLGGSRPPADRPPHAVTSYGLTESCGGVVYDGRPLPGVEMRIADDGEVLLRSPTLMRSYRSSDAPHPIVDGWLHTADLGEIDGGGQLRVHGRRGEMIISGGENVWPEQVEAILHRHRDVADVGVIGIDDREWGQRVVAAVVPADAGQPPSLAALRTHCHDYLPAFMAPKQLVFVDAVPRTALGKVARSALRQLVSDVGAEGPQVPARGV